MCLTCHAPKTAVYSPLWAPEMQIVWLFSSADVEESALFQFFLMICSLNYLADVHLFVDPSRASFVPPGLCGDVLNTEYLHGWR